MRQDLGRALGMLAHLGPGMVVLGQTRSGLLPAEQGLGDAGGLGGQKMQKALTAQEEKQPNPNKPRV